MKKKSSQLENPVLHFGSTVAKDLIAEDICTHFKKAGKGLLAWENEMHLGMLKAMQNDKTTKDLKVWLSKQLPKELHDKISGLLSRYVRIQDSDVRKKAFLSGKQNFWDASRTVRNPRSTEAYYKSIVYRVAWMLIKQDTPVSQFANDVQECMDEINNRNL